MIPFSIILIILSIAGIISIVASIEDIRHRRISKITFILIIADILFCIGFGTYEFIITSNPGYILGIIIPIGAYCIITGINAYLGYLGKRYLIGNADAIILVMLSICTSVTIAPTIPYVMFIIVFGSIMLALIPYLLEIEMSILFKNYGKIDKVEISFIPCILLAWGLNVITYFI